MRTGINTMLYRNLYSHKVHYWKQDQNVQTKTRCTGPRPALVWDRSCHKTTVSDHNTDKYQLRLVERGFFTNCPGALTKCQKAILNRWRLRSCLNLLVSVMSLMLWGSEFQAAGPAYWSSVHRTSIEDDVWRSQQCRRTSDQNEETKWDRVYGWIPRLTAQSLPCTVVHVRCGLDAWAYIKFKCNSVLDR